MRRDIRRLKWALAACGAAMIAFTFALLHKPSALAIGDRVVIDDNGIEITNPDGSRTWFNGKTIYVGRDLGAGENDRGVWIRPGEIVVGDHSNEAAARILAWSDGGRRATVRVESKRNGAPFYPTASLEASRSRVELSLQAPAPDGSGIPDRGTVLFAETPRD